MKLSFVTPWYGEFAGGSEVVVRPYFRRLTNLASRGSPGRCAVISCLNDEPRARTGATRELPGPDVPGAGPRPLKIAYFSPLPPQKSGVATYSKELLAHLGRYARIDLFTDDGIAPAPEIRDRYPCFSYLDYEKRLASEKYDATLYHMGNHAVHEYVYRTLLKHPGIVVLHDYVLHNFMQSITVQKGDGEAYVEAMRDAYGREGEKRARSFLDGFGTFIDLTKYPLNERVIAASRCVIVHSRYVKDRIARGGRVEVIPHGRDPVSLDAGTIGTYRKELGLDSSAPVVGCFGFMNPNRRLNVLAEAFAAIAPAYPGARLLLVGNIKKAYRESIVDLCKRLGIAGQVTFTGFVDGATYRKYLACVDVAVNLRFPTMGETSGTLLDAMAFGKPVIVSNVGAYREYPDSCCWRVDVDGTERELLQAYLAELLKNGPLRARMGNNARAYVSEHLRWEKVAAEYVSLVRELAGDRQGP